MRFLPFEKITYETKLTEEELISRLTDYIDTKDFFEIRLISNEERLQSYEGEINKQKFRIRRITDSIRNIPPFIIGDIESNFDKTIIKVKIRLPIGYMIWLSMWFTLLAIFFFFYTLNNPFDFFTIILVGFISFAYIRIISGFNAESSWAKTDFEALFEAEKI